MGPCVRLLFLAALVLWQISCAVPRPAARQIPSPGASVPVPVSASAADDPLHGLAIKVFALANRQRRLRGLRELEWSDTLSEQARLQSMNMMERGFFSHTDPLRGPLTARLNAAGIRWTRCGENIFREHGLDDPADATVEGWMKSPPHRESLLDPLFTHGAVGIAISPDTDYFITEIFLR